MKNMIITIQENLKFNLDPLSKNAKLSYFKIL